MKRDNHHNAGKAPAHSGKSSEAALAAPVVLTPDQLDRISGGVTIEEIISALVKKGGFGTTSGSHK